MNIQAELGNRVEGPEGPRECEHWQQLVFPSTFAHAARIRPFGPMLPIDTVANKSHGLSRLEANLQRGVLCRSCARGMKTRPTALRKAI